MLFFNQPEAQEDRNLGIILDGRLQSAPVVQVININSASYPAWAYRWQCLEALGTSEILRREQTFLEHIAASNVKNYQLWNHRRRLAFTLGLNSAHDVRHFILQLSMLYDCKNLSGMAATEEEGFLSTVRQSSPLHRLLCHVIDCQRKAET